MNNILREKNSNALRFLLLAFTLITVATLISFFLTQGSSEVTIWAPGPDWGYEIPNDLA